MFKITEGDFANQIYGNESYLSNWPMNEKVLENFMRHAIGIICTLYGQIMSYTVREILIYNFMEFWRKICDQVMIMQDDKVMIFGIKDLLYSKKMSTYTIKKIGKRK